MAAINKKVSLSVKNEVDMVIIQIPESSARNILNRHFDKIGKSKGWINALIFFIPFTITYFTSEFSDKTVMGWEISADQIIAFFFFCWLLSCAYLICTIINAFRCRVSVDKIIEDLKANRDC